MCVTPYITAVSWVEHFLCDLRWLAPCVLLKGYFWAALEKGASVTATQWEQGKEHKLGPRGNAQVWAQTQKLTCTCTNTLPYICTPTPTHTRALAHTCARTHVRAHTHIHMQTRRHTDTHTGTHTDTHTLTHTQKTTTHSQAHTTDHKQYTNSHTQLKH